MKHTYLIAITLFVASCSENKQADQPEKSLPVSKAEEKAVFPTQAKPRHTDHPEDTLVASAGGKWFEITPDGKLSWGKDPADTFHLSTDLTVERAFLYSLRDTLFIFYTETDFEDAGSVFEKIDLQKKKRLLKAFIPGFNLGRPAIRGGFAYVTAIGTAGKLNLQSGKYVYKYSDLYDRTSYAFNSFDTIIFKDDLTVFISKNYNSGNRDSLIVNEKTGKRTIRK